MITFGTGSFFRNQDNSLSDPQVQTLYGVRDDGGNQSLGDRDDMLEQTIVSQSVKTALGEPRIVREISNNQFGSQSPGNGSGEGGGGTEKIGWFLDLQYNGLSTASGSVSKFYTRHLNALIR